MRQSDLTSVSTLHLRTLPTMTARIGAPYLFSLYETLLRNTGVNNVLVATEDRQIIGVISATSDLSETQKRLQHAFVRPENLQMIIVAIIRGRVTIRELMDRISFERQIFRFSPQPYPTILTFFVSKTHQHQGIGEKLLHALEKQLSFCNKLYVDTELTNTFARKWYRNHGFRFVRTIQNNAIAVKTLTAAP